MQTLTTNSDQINSFAYSVFQYVAEKIKSKTLSISIAIETLQRLFFILW